MHDFVGEFKRGIMYITIISWEKWSNHYWIRELNSVKAASSLILLNVILIYKKGKMQ